MNPVIIFALFALLYQEDNHFPNYFDTFKLEQTVEKFNHVVVSLNQINHLNELAHQPLIPGKIAHTIEDSIHTVKPLLPEGKRRQQLDSVASVLDGMKRLGDFQNLAKTMGPVMNMLGNLDTQEASDEENEEEPAGED
ncbi:hypothetical protein [Clostridium aminobutyricum]|uniref:Uncharacterized protein n=1 Tax=Clostridium aminobutyricum TaxID=33953 RepID=A0A939IJA6_CLOAM|nr:hypothetical protein [Clostridium aminobutyricum]MBN7773906.1 hypothetical protein [Clostridium aminobutyricum]